MEIVINGNVEQVEFINDYGDGLTGILFLIGHEFGWTHLVNAECMTDAEDAWLDEQPTVPEDELWEAYGFKSREDYEAFNDTPGAKEYPNLVEGYLPQSNSTGTGVVEVGHYHNIVEVHIGEVQLKLGRQVYDHDVARVRMLEDIARRVRRVPNEKLKDFALEAKAALTKIHYGP